MASTRSGADASLLAQYLDMRLAYEDSLRTSERICLIDIPSADETMRKLGMFSFVTSHLFSVGRNNSSNVAELLRLIERLEELHTKVQVTI